MNGFLAIVVRAFRGVREHAYLFIVGSGVIGGALFVLGLYGMVVANLRDALGTWRTDVHISAYFDPTAGKDARVQAQAALAARPDVAGVEYVDEAAAQLWMAERMPELDTIVKELGTDVLPASLEITLKDADPSGDSLATFAASLTQMGVFEVVDYGEEWVRRFQALVSLLGAVGLTLGALIATAASLMVANTIQLAVHSRRDEIEIMRLVGATDGYILTPFLVEGATEGLLGASVALLGLWAVHEGLMLKLHAMFSVAFGGQSMGFLPFGWVLALLLIGASLGVIAAFVAVRRFLLRVQ